jgi:hypothetical protein
MDSVNNRVGGQVISGGARNAQKPSPSCFLCPLVLLNELFRISWRKSINLTVSTLFLKDPGTSRRH